MVSTRATSTTSTSSATSQNQVGADNGALGISTGDDATITVTAQEAWELGEQALSALANAADASLEIVDSSQRVLSTAFETQVDANKSEAGQISEQLIKVGIPAAAIALVAYGVLKK